MKDPFPTHTCLCCYHVTVHKIANFSGQSILILKAIAWGRFKGFLGTLFLNVGIVLLPADSFFLNLKSVMYFLVKYSAKPGALS